MEVTERNGLVGATQQSNCRGQVNEKPDKLRRLTNDKLGSHKDIAQQGASADTQICRRACLPIGKTDDIDVQ